MLICLPFIQKVISTKIPLHRWNDLTFRVNLKKLNEAKTENFIFKQIQSNTANLNQIPVFSQS